MGEVDVANLPLYADPTMDLFNTLKQKGLAFGMPTTLIVDKDGCQVAHLSGPAVWDSDDAKALVAVLMNRKQS